MKIKDIGAPYAYQTSPIIHVLRNRGITDETVISSFINNDLDKYNNSPSLLNNVEEGINCLEHHINSDSEIYLIVDCDVDGYTSAAELVLYIRNRYNYNKIKFIMHDGKEHGIEMDKIPSDCNLLIIPDAASNDYKEHKKLKEQGVDILILDHHEADKGESEDAIVINNQLSPYPNKSLCGAAVVYKFLQAIDEKHGDRMADNYLDLVSLGLISDMMDMRNPETFNLIQKGLRKVVKNEFYEALLEKQSYSIGQYVTPISIAFYITPLINACIRVGSNEEKAVVFKAFIDPFDELESTKRGHKPGDIEICKDQAVRYVVNAKSKQTRLRDKGLEKIEDIIEDRQLLENKILFIEIQDELDKNITGLIANQLMSKYQRPVLLLRNEGGKVLNGSGRSYDKSNLDNFREYLSDTGFFNFCQGHNSAFGASIDKEKADDFLTYSNEQLKDFNFEVSYDVDFRLNMDEDADRLEPILDNINSYIYYWGKDMEEPLFSIENVKVDGSTTSLIGKGKNTLKIVSGDVTLIKFNLSESEQNKFSNILSSGETAYLNIVGRPNKNEWGGNVTQQVLITDYVISKQVMLF